MVSSPNKRQRTSSDAKAPSTKPSAKGEGIEEEDEGNVSLMLQVAIEAARLAGAHMKANLATSQIEKTKSSKDDLVTVIDKQCQDLIFKKIQSQFPTHAFLGEENVDAGSEASTQALEANRLQKWLWIVDPIDGTTNFVHKRPASVVSIACASKGQMQLGVIYDPYRDEMFTCEKGKGTFLNNKRVQVSAQETSFEQALIGFGIGTKDSVRIPMLRCVEAFSSKCRGIRLQGAAALELAWIACGRQTGFYELDLNAWDIAAGSLLIQEAGGQVTDSEGNAFSLSTRNCVASNGKGQIHARLLEMIKKANAVHVLQTKS